MNGLIKNTADERRKYEIYGIKKSYKKSSEAVKISDETIQSIQSIEASNIKQLEKTSNYCIELKIRTESELIFDLTEKEYVDVN